ncbi:gustatory receptor for sugar taste 43a-like [Phymastichus coffea]|uniref:gustatory receptor for sugar taste 43a-like n=1 Tax=Phymastichus coffea TaxID=108790 RepID=UPI00273BA8BF|nr:gustatory receptor for sugar taste 43a-like [Phymastichus coffea]
MEAWRNLKKKALSRQKNQNCEAKAREAIETDVYYTLVPTDYMSKVCGLSAVKLIPNKEAKTSDKVDSGAVAYGIALAVALTAAQCWGLYRDTRDGWQNSTRLFSKTAIAVTGSDVFFVICVTIFAILGSSTRWKHVHHALDKIVQADAKLDVSTTPTINLRKLSIILIACTMVYLISISTLDYISWKIVYMPKMNNTKNTDKGPINYSPMYFMYMVIVALQMQYAIILMNLGERFSRLNSTIECLTKTNDIIDYFRKDMGLAARGSRHEVWRPFVGPSDSRNRQRRFSRAAVKPSEGTIDARADSTPRDRAAVFAGAMCGSGSASEAIEQLIAVHEILCDSIIRVNKAYGVILLLCTLSCLIHLVITLYFLYAEINSSTRRSYVFIRQIGWIIFHIYKMMLFVQPPYMVTYKAQVTGSLVSKALASEWDPQVRKQLERFALQLLHRPVKFNACGLFCLNRGLLTSMTGAVTTYLVILVQFQNSDDDETRKLLQNASDLLKNVHGVGKP